MVKTSKATWKMNNVELARVVADHFGFTVKGNWIIDDKGRPVAVGWEMFANKLAARRGIVVGQGVHWPRLGQQLVLPRVTRTAEGYWV